MLKLLSKIKIDPGILFAKLEYHHKRYVTVSKKRKTIYNEPCNDYRVSWWNFNNSFIFTTSYSYLENTFNQGSLSRYVFAFFCWCAIMADLWIIP